MKDFYCYSFANSCFNNRINFCFRKIDIETGYKINGATFILILNGKIIAKKKSNKYGLVKFNNLKPGIYILKETTPADGYILDDIEHVVNVISKDCISLDGILSCNHVIADSRAITFSFLKTDLLGNALEGAEFKLYKNNELIDTAISIFTGYVYFHNVIKDTTYTMIETVSPTGYNKNSRVYNVYVALNGEIFIDNISVKNFTVQNTPLTFDLTFLKLDFDTNLGIPNALFELSNNGTIVSSTSSDINGNVVFENLNSGNYTLIEKTPADNYISNTIIHNVIINNSGYITIDNIDSREFVIYNKKYPNLSFTKVNEANIPLEYATFELRDSNNNSITATSDELGNVTFTTLHPGSYTLQETIPPAGYIANSTLYNIEVDKECNITIDGLLLTNFKVVNILEDFNLSLTKIDETTQAPLENSSFELLQDGTRIAIAISNPAGQILFENITSGNYILKELLPPPGYIPNTREYNVIVDENGKVTIDGIESKYYYILNTPLPDISFKKTNENDIPLEYAQFNLLKDGVIIDTAISDSNGIVLFRSTKPGDYTLQETIAPPGYVPDTTIYNIIVNMNGGITINEIPQENFVIRNALILYDLSFTKLDTYDKIGIRDTIYGLFENNTKIAMAVSNDAGQVLFENLTPGIYTLREISAAPNYIPSGEIYNVIVKENGEITINDILAKDFIVYNKRFPSLNILKTNSSGEALSGGVYELRLNDYLIETTSADSLGYIKFNQLAPGIYNLVEVLAPTGYELNSIPHIVEVFNSGEIFIDELNQHDFKLVNIEETIDILGEKIWNDKNNINHTRPDTITIVLYSNGTVRETKTIPTDNLESNQFVFNNLPRYDKSGFEIFYTIDEISNYTGYAKSINDYIITNNLVTFSVTVNYIDINTSQLLFTNIYQVYYGGDITLYAPTLIGYTALQPTEEVYINITNDITHNFYYNKINTNNDIN